MKKLWSKLPKELRVALYIGFANGIWALVKALGVEFEGNAFAVAIINILVVLLEVRVPQVRAKLSK